MNLPGLCGVLAKSCSSTSIWEMWGGLELLSIGRMHVSGVHGTHRIYLKTATRASYRFLFMVTKCMDPGAVSVVGWCSDLSYGVDALLQYGLICVYSEYCECESTYGEIMEAVLPRFQYLCDPNVPHPWKDEFRFVLAGVRGDPKWINDKYKIQNYRLNDFCSRCSCVKNAVNVYETITAFGDTAQHVPVDNSSFCDSQCVEDWPWPMRFGVHLERFCHDTCHSQLLGSGKCLNGSALIYLCEQGFFTGGEFGSGVYDAALQVQLQHAYSDFRSWQKSA